MMGIRRRHAGAETVTEDAPSPAVEDELNIVDLRPSQGKLRLPPQVGRGFIDDRELQPFSGADANIFMQGSAGAGASGARSLLHPLTSAERQLVARQIQREVSESIAETLEAEQRQEDQLRSVHLKTVSLIIVAIAALGACVIYLRVVMVPTLVALFFTFLLEPLLFALLNPPEFARICCPKAKFVSRLASRIDQARFEANEVHWASSQRSATERRPQSHSEADSRLTASQESEDGQATGCQNGRNMVQSAAAKSWTMLAVLCCILSLLGVLASVVYAGYKAVAAFEWDKYAQSHRLRLVLSWFPVMGEDPGQLNPENLIPWLLEGPIFNALDLTLTIISQAFLTLLFLGFFLATDASSARDEDFDTVGHRIRASCRRYIRIKTTTALVVSVLTGMVYWLWAVDLYFLFTVFTFIFYYIPHVGNTIAILLPIPLIFLDPTKSALDILLLFAIPFVIHQLATNLVDPKLLADSLELHPIIVLLSLAFWTTLFGPVGAILSVPLTAVLRILLIEVDHPYTRPVVLLLQGNVKDLSAASDVASIGNVTPRSSVPASRSPHPQCAFDSPVPSASTRNITFCDEISPVGAYPNHVQTKCLDNAFEQDEGEVAQDGGAFLPSGFAATDTGLGLKPQCEGAGHAGDVDTRPPEGDAAEQPEASSAVTEHAESRTMLQL